MTHTQDMRREIVRRHMAGESATSIARTTGVSADTVRRWWREDRPRAIDRFLSRPAPEVRR